MLNSPGTLNHAGMTMLIYPEPSAAKGYYGVKLNVTSLAGSLSPSRFGKLSKLRPGLFEVTEKLPSVMLPAKKLCCLILVEDSASPEQSSELKEATLID